MWRVGLITYNPWYGVLAIPGEVAVIGGWDEHGVIEEVSLLPFVTTQLSNEWGLRMQIPW